MERARTARGAGALLGAALGSALAVAALPFPAAAEQVRVAVVAPESAESLVRRLEAELATLDLATEVVRSEGADLGAEALARLAAGSGATFVLVLSPAEPAIDAWAAGGPRPRLLDRARGRPGAGGEAAVAIQVAESLRAALIEVEARAPRRAAAAEGSVPREGTADETPLLPPPTPRSPWPLRRLELGLGAGLGWAPGGLGPTGHLLLEVGFCPLPWLGLHVVGVAPLHAAVLRGPEGEADVWLGLVGGGASAGHADRSGRFGGSVGVGVAVALLEMQGRANEPYEGLEDLVATAVPYALPRATVRLTAWLRLSLAAMIGVAAARPVVLFAGRSIASWGRPFLLVALGLEGLPL